MHVEMLHLKMTQGEKYKCLNITGYNTEVSTNCPKQKNKQKKVPSGFILYKVTVV